jgi:hypothetical protein
VLLGTTATWITVGWRVANPFLPYRTSREGRQILLGVSAALSLAMAAQAIGLHAFRPIESGLAAAWLGLVALAWFGRL